MLNAILFLVGGIFIGRLFRSKVNKFKHLALPQTFIIILMLFALGLSVGINHSIMNNLSSLGIQSLLISFLCILGSLIVAWLYWKFSFWHKNK